MTKQKEYGGYLPLELHKGTPYYTGESVVALNSGRYAILYAVQDAGFHTMWIPFFLCPTVEETLRAAGIVVKYYHIDQNFRPMQIPMGNGEGILWVNFYGIMREELIDEIVAAYGDRLILDQTQSFFSTPRMGVYQAYSCRKFFGVSDGAYVIKEGIGKRELKQDQSSKRSLHLLTSVEYGTNYSYSISKSNENYLDSVGMRAMSQLTTQIMAGIDYERVRTERKNNFLTLRNLLGEKNHLSFCDTCIPMNYPFMAESGELRSRLIEKQIYVAQLWKETMQLREASEWERELADKICIPPIDQRYTPDDMNYIAETVLELNK